MPPPLIFSESAFNGLDANSAPDQVQPGFLTQCDDCVFFGQELQTRPGFRAKLSSALSPGYIGPGIPYAKNDGTQLYIFVVGSSATDNTATLRYWTKGSTSTTAINSGGVVFTVNQVQMARFDNFIFLVGATDGKVYRYAPETGTFEGITGATTPTYSVAASLTNKTLLAMSSSANVVADTQSGNVTVDNPYFAGGSTSPVAPGSVLDSSSKWLYANTSPTYSECVTGIAALSGGGASVTGTSHTSTLIDSIASTTGMGVGMSVTGSGVPAGAYIVSLTSTSITLSAATSSSTTNTFVATPRFMRLDAVGDSLVSNVFYNNVAKTTPYNGTASEAVTRYITDWVVRFQFHGDNSTQAITCNLQVFSSNSGGGTLVATMSQTVTGATSPGTTQQITLTFSATGQCLDTQALYLKLQFTCAAGSAGPNGPYFWNPEISSVLGSYNLIPAVTASNGALIAYPNGGDLSTLRLNSFHISMNLGAEYSNTPQNLTAFTQIAIVYKSFLPGIPTPRVKLRLRSGATLAAAIADASPQDSAEMVIYTDTGGQQYLTADVGTLTRSQVWLIDFVFSVDVAFPGSLGASAYLIGPIISAGGLSVGYSPYLYAIREKTATTGYLSQAIYASPGLIPTQVQATAKLVFSANPPTNASAVTEIWRAGGTGIDGLFRKVAEISAAGSVTSPYSSSYVTYSSGTFTDSTPDSALQAALTMTDHTAPAFGAVWGNAVAVAVFAQRLAIATSTTSITGVTPGVFLSQVAYGGENGLYWDVANDLSATNLSTQGWYRRISGNENANSGQAIVRMVPYQQTLVLLFKDSISHIFGTDPSSFDIFRYLGTTQRGAIAPGAVTIFNNVVYYLSEDGLRFWDGSDIRKESTLIDRALNPQASLTGTPLNATGYAASVLFSHSQRLCLAAPFTSSDTATAGLYLLDEQAGNRWMRWNKTGITGGFVFSSAADQNDFYVTTTGGQIYQVSGGTYGDTSTSAGPASAVSLAVTSRAYTGDTRRLRGERLAFAAYSDDSAPVYVATITGEGDATARQYALTYTGATGETVVGRVKVASRVFGRYLQYAFSATPSVATKYAILRRFELIATEDKLI